MNQKITLSDEQLSSILEMKNSDIWADDIVLEPKEGSFKVENMKNIKLHEYVYINPPHDNNEFEKLVRSLAINGQIEPVKIWEKRGTKFIIDGRHRFLGLKKLGAEYIKYITIPSNTTKEELKTMVIESENKRQMTPAQNAIRAWNDYSENHQVSKLSMRAYASRYHTGHTVISRCKTIVSRLGSKVLDDMFMHKQVKIGGKYYSSLNQLVTLIEDMDKQGGDNNYDVPKSAEPIMGTLHGMFNNGDDVGLAYVKKYSERKLAELNKSNKI